MNFFWDCPGTERERLALAEPYASRSLMSTLPLVPPLFPAGKEPLPPGFTEDDRQVMLQNKRMQNYMQMGMESCLAKTTMAAGMGAQSFRRPTLVAYFLCAPCSRHLPTVGFGMGAFISLMSSSFAYEDPLIRQQQQALGAISTTAKAREIFAEMGRGMWRSGKGFAKVTVLFAGTECVIESVSSCPLPAGNESMCSNPVLFPPLFPSFVILLCDTTRLACAVSGSERHRKCCCGRIHRRGCLGSQYWAKRCLMGWSWICSILGGDRPLPAARNT